MSFEAAAWAIKQSPELATEKLILIALADCHNRDTGRCDPSLATLSEVALCSSRTAIRAIDSLEKQGFISTIKESGKRTNYVLLINKTTDIHDTCDNVSPLTESHTTPDTHVTGPLTPMSPEPVIPVKNQESINPDALTQKNKDQLFNFFWEQYPKKVDKKAANKKMMSILKGKNKEFGKNLINQICENINLRLETGAWRVDDGQSQFIPGPAKYLLNELWEDEVHV